MRPDLPMSADAYLGVPESAFGLFIPLRMPELCGKCVLLFRGFR